MDVLLLIPNFCYGYAQLIFSLARYESVIDAYLDGLEVSGLSDLSRVTSVASFLVSQVDILVDKMLEKIAANAQAALAYQLYQKKFFGPRSEALVKKGAKKQRLLWASTSIKNPAYPDTLYVTPLVVPSTVSHLFILTVVVGCGHVFYFLYFLEFILNVHIYRLFFPHVSTMPDQALQAFIDHDTVARTIDLNVSEAEGIYNALEKLGIHWSHVGS
ncbi:unnamed protein product [Ilex paraguariensis]|uniref:Transaldolase n=1 Tax=Ilex paraguariensis TaxID=185542 RepID=A0ABC8QXN0_9AQUA